MDVNGKENGQTAAAGSNGLQGKGQNSTDAEEEARRKKSANTEKLLAQLHALEDEARSLGLDPEAVEAGAGGSPYGRGRGFARGRGRGGYRGYAYDPSYQSPRGAYRGRGGSFRGSVRGGGAYNLDNRPKKVKVEGVVFDGEKEEALKQFLFVSRLLT